MMTMDLLNSRWSHPSRLESQPPSPLQRETLTTAAATLPFDNVELRNFARLDDYGDSVEIENAIASAVAFVEQELGRAILAQTWTITIEGMFPNAGIIPWRQPFGGVSSIQTVRADDDDELWLATDYIVKPGGVIKALNSDRRRLSEDDWVEIVYTAGYANADAVPGDLMQAIKIVAHEFYVWDRDIRGADRPSGWPGGSWELARPYMVFRGVGEHAAR